MALKCLYFILLKMLYDCFKHNDEHRGAVFFKEIIIKWIKHYSSASISNALTEILAEYGPIGYGRYWLLLESMCEKFDGESDTKFVFNARNLRSKLGFHRGQDLIKFLSSLNQVGIMSHLSRNQVIEIESDILLRLQGRDYKKARSKRGETAPKKETKIKTKIKKEDKEITATKKNPKSTKVWASYAQSFSARYGAQPIRNAKVNKILCNLVDRLGEETAIKVSGFYVDHNNYLYVNSMHSVDLLLRDAEKLATELQTGMTVGNQRLGTAQQKQNNMLDILKNIKGRSNGQGDGSSSTILHNEGNRCNGRKNPLECGDAN